MTVRFLIGGPKDSGKSTLTLSLVERFRAPGRTAEAVEFDVWAGTFPAFRGEVTFEKRERHPGYDWDWRTPLARRIDQFRASQADYVFGDLAGELNHTVAWTVAKAEPDAAIVVSSTLEGLSEWTKTFEQLGVNVAHGILTFAKPDQAPLVVSAMCRKLDPNNPGVIDLCGRLLAAEPKTR
jgi:hypothetical protein